MNEVRYREAGPDGRLVEVSADGPHGAIGPDGVSPAQLPKAQMLVGELRAQSGGPYRLQPHTAPTPAPLYRLTIRDGHRTHSVRFRPLPNHEGVIDVNAQQETP
ncbi:hypothetical protein [Deinococcus sp. Marseille-Q6407]|uniref:hypothetical protein n=1 Tax=Deinococcus sp. Marseille-Q6407 TaxID=2969223 RepID=UPI0021C14711|nr:hypothetical protein [Deinococcus sp. Marseille-Q6407]